MLSYRHAFHAGNFADVLKHLILVECLEYLKLKDKPFAYYDSHAGPGAYALDSEYALKNREFASGIGQLWEAAELPAPLQRYREVIRHFNPDHSLTDYPGSPAIAAHCLRDQDRLCLSELHTTEFDHLKNNFRVDRRAEVWKDDGFIRILKQLPPRERRALILIDPPYELKEDYTRVAEFLSNSHRKFAQGVYLIWYPVVDRSRIDHLEASLRQSGIRNIQLYELGIQADTATRGMTASGMIVVNPPWTLRPNMESTLPDLLDRLQLDSSAHLRIEQLAEE